MTDKGKTKGNDKAEDNAVEPLDPEEAAGDQSGSQDPAAVGSFDPNAARATSGPPPDAQSGVPDLTTGENEGVEPGDLTERDDPPPAE